MLPMFKTDFSKKFTDAVIHFTDVFHRKNIEQFIDSWITNEDVIIESYQLFAKNLRNMIFQKVWNYFSHDIIAKSISQENSQSFSIITIHTLRAFVYYSEDINSRTRYIEDIEFFRK